jgi:hypothetical protein
MKAPGSLATAMAVAVSITGSVSRGSAVSALDICIQHAKTNWAGQARAAAYTFCNSRYRASQEVIRFDPADGRFYHWTGIQWVELKPTQNEKRFDPSTGYYYRWNGTNWIEQ